MTSPTVTSRRHATPNQVGSFLNMRVDIAAVFADGVPRCRFPDAAEQHQYGIRCYIRVPDGYVIEVETTDRGLVAVVASSLGVRDGARRVPGARRRGDQAAPSMTAPARPATKVAKVAATSQRATWSIRRPFTGSKTRRLIEPLDFLGRLVVGCVEQDRRRQ